MNTQEIKVFGHRSPDTDASCSAVVWAWFLSTHRNKNARPYILGAVNTEAQFVIDHFGITMPTVLESINEAEKVAIVDTNNLDELFKNINQAEIVSLIDHHKLTGTLTTNLPTEIIIQPYASTMTVMYKAMDIEISQLPTEIAGIMLAGIISDTLEFRSPTTTTHDTDLAKELAEYTNINISDLAKKMFDAKSDIAAFSAEELIRMDSKIYEIQGKQSRVSVLETTNPQMILDRQQEIIAAYPTVKKEDNVEEIYLFAVDILKQEAILFVANENIKSIAAESFAAEINGDTLVLPGVVSRKKQILPVLGK